MRGTAAQKAASESKVHVGMYVHMMSARLASKIVHAIIGLQTPELCMS